MNIFEFVENLSLDRSHIAPEIREQIIKAYSLDQWLGVVKIFLSGLDKNHRVPGKDIQRLYHYLNHYQERNRLEWKQQWHVVSIIIDYWDQMSCESRAMMLL